MKNSILFLLLISFINCKSQTKIVENRDVVYYYKELKSIEIKERNNQNLTIDSVTISTKYLDTVTKKLNFNGVLLLQEIKEKVFNHYFEDYLFLQQIKHENKVYALYFTMLSLYDAEFVVFAYNDDNWNYLERINRKLVDTSEHLMKVKLNYEEVPKKKIHEATIFIKNNFLVFDLGGLYLSSFNIKTNKLLFEEENPYQISQLYDKEANKKWVNKNVHEKINEQLNK